MVTECCKAKSIVQGNSVWCTGCGAEVDSQVQWVTGYNNPNTYRAKFPVYSRTKRFKNFILELKKLTIFMNFNPIMDTFGLIEFHWGIHGSKTRKYFFNKGCVLHYILQFLELDLEVRTLKDEERVATQIIEMDRLLLYQF